MKRDQAIYIAYVGAALFILGFMYDSNSAILVGLVLVAMAFVALM